MSILPPSVLELFKRPAVTGLTAVAEAMFPANAYGAPDWREAEVVPRTLAYLEELPPMPRRLLWALFSTVEVSAPLAAGVGRRFSRLSPARRADAIRKLRSSRLAPRRLLGDALKATMTMMYVSHPKVMAHLGERTGGMKPGSVE